MSSCRWIAAGFPIVRPDRGLFGARDRRPARGGIRNA
jgi:hypothetical protein